MPINIGANTDIIFKIGQKKVPDIFRFSSLAFKAPILPIISQNPSNQIRAINNTAIFNSDATGYPNPTVQWQISIDGGLNWSNIGSANNQSYVTPSLDSSYDNFMYRAVWSNKAGSVISQPALLTIGTPPVITKIPTPVGPGAVDRGTYRNYYQKAPGVSGGYFYSEASGNPTPTALWQYSSNFIYWFNIATGGTVYFPTFACCPTYYFRVIWSNSLGSVTSGNVYLAIRN